MEIIDSIETAAGTALGAIEHPFHTIGDRLKAAGEHLAEFFGHPYCPPALREGLTKLQAVVADLAQEVAELRVPCPCKPGPTPSTGVAGDAGQTGASTNAAGGAGESGDEAPESATLTGDELAEFRQFQAHKAAFEQFASAITGA